MPLIISSPWCQHPFWIKATSRVQSSREEGWWCEKAFNLEEQTECSKKAAEEPLVSLHSSGSQWPSPGSPGTRRVRDPASLRVTPVLAVSFPCSPRGLSTDLGAAGRCQPQGRLVPRSPRPRGGAGVRAPHGRCGCGRDIP